MSLNALEKRIIELSYKHKLSHISSCMNAVHTLEAIYARKERKEPIICGNGHASLAHYVVLEAHGMCDAEDMVKGHGTHAHRDPERGIEVSCGSLGQPETVAVGLALADRARKVWLLTSDGSCQEGAVWEAFALAAEQKLDNLKIYIIANGWGAYKPIDTDSLRDRLALFLHPLSFELVRPKMPFQFLEGLAGHYLTLNQQQYDEAMVA